MKKTILFVTVIAAICLTCCTQFNLSRTIEVTIPSHPWEEASGRRLWYTLRWTDGNCVRSVHVGQDQRTVEISALAGNTVVIAAYPLGDLNPFGAVLTPVDRNGLVQLNQNDGVVAALLLDIDVEISKRLNYGLIRERMLEITDDFRLIEHVSLLRDIQNGELSDSSFSLSQVHEIGPFALPNGVWESEYSRDPAIISSDSFSCPVKLPDGVFRFLNAETLMELVLIVDENGDRYSYLRRSPL